MYGWSYPFNQRTLSKPYPINILKLETAFFVPGCQVVETLTSQVLGYEEKNIQQNLG